MPIFCDQPPHTELTPAEPGGADPAERLQNMNAYATTFNAIGETLDRIAHRADREFRLAREEAADARDEQVIAGLNRKIDTLRMMLAERSNELGSPSRPSSHDNEETPRDR
jgi:hypothetical protein